MKLKEQPGGGEVTAVLHDLLTLEALFAAEEQWCFECVRVLWRIGCRRHSQFTRSMASKHPLELGAQSGIVCSIAAR